MSAALDVAKPASQCVICIREDAAYINTKVAKHEMTDKQAADHFNVSERIWAAHYESHVLRRLVTALSTEITPLREIVIDKVKVVAESVDRLRKIILFMSEDFLTNPDKHDSKDILALGQMERNIAQTVKDLAQIQGELSTGDTTNIQINIQKADKLMSIIMETASPEYKRFLLNKLEEDNA